MVQRVETALPSRTRPSELASVAVALPAHKDFVVVIRSATAQLAACFGYTIHEVGDLRLAVTEACALLIAGTSAAGDAAEPYGTIDCRAVIRGDLLRVTLSAPAPGFGAPDTDSFGWTILTALVDSLAWAHDGLTARIDLEKRRGVPPASPG